MAGDRVVVVDGVDHHFPSDATDEEISAALNGGAPAQGTHGGLTLAMAGESVPVAAKAAMELATSPSVPKTAATIGRIAGAVGPASGEMATGNLPAAIAMLGNAGKTAWMGGKSGFFTGKLLQRASVPVAAITEKIAPYAQTLSTLGAAAGVGDLAQLAEPDRTDIGFMGIGHGTPDPQHPAMLNAIYAAIRKRLSGQP